MASFDYTMELERALLKLLTSSLMTCRMHIHRLREDRFSSVERQFILQEAQRAFAQGKGMLTKTVFEYEVGSKVDDNDQTYFITEWNLIEALDPKEAPELLIEKLEEAHLGRQTLEVSKGVTALLEAGRVTDAVAHLKTGAVSLRAEKDVGSVRELTDYSSREEAIQDRKEHPEKYAGLKTGFQTFDRITGGLFPGELTLIAGITGVGKSTIVRQLQKGIVTHPDNGQRNVLHIANEEYQQQVEYKFDSLFTGVPYLRFKLADITDSEVEAWKKLMDEWPYGRVFIREVPAFTDVSLVEQTHRELESKGIQIHAITIDHLPHVKPIQQAWGENDERFKAAADCKEIARWLRLPVIIPTQAATVVEEKQQKGKRGGKLDVYGSKGQVHVSNTFMLITEQGRDDTQTDREEWERDAYWLCDIKKGRDGPPFWFRAKHLVRVGQVIEVPKDDAGSGAKDDTVAKEIEDAVKENGTSASTPPPAPTPVQQAQANAQAAPSSILEKMRARAENLKKGVQPSV